MGRVTYYVAMAYEKTPKGKITPGMPIQAKTADHAKRVAERLAATRPGAVAFSRTGDPEFGEWDDAVVLAAYGVAEEAEERAA